VLLSRDGAVVALASQDRSGSVAEHSAIVSTVVPRCTREATQMRVNAPALRLVICFERGSPWVRTPPLFPLEAPNLAINVMSVLSFGVPR
jgi:hypothetical protein